MSHLEKLKKHYAETACDDGKTKKELYYVQPDGSWSKHGDRRSKGVCYCDLPPDAVIS